MIREFADVFGMDLVGRLEHTIGLCTRLNVSLIAHAGTNICNHHIYHEVHGADAVARKTVLCLRILYTVFDRNCVSAV